MHNVLCHAAVAVDEEIAAASADENSEADAAEASEQSDSSSEDTAHDTPVGALLTNFRQKVLVLPTLLLQGSLTLQQIALLGYDACKCHTKMLNQVLHVYMHGGSF